MMGFHFNRILGVIGLGLGSHINPYLESIMTMVKQGLAARRAGCLEAMRCVSLLAQALGPALNQYMNDILGLMFETGLSPTLTQCLTDIVKYVPSYLPVIQERLLDLLSVVLSGKPYYHSGTPASFRKKKVVAQVRPSLSMETINPHCGMSCRFIINDSKNYNASNSNVSNVSLCLWLLVVRFKKERPSITNSRHI
jgi:phosphatidylinositol kinase/protein kinase (PI-3  family)